MAVQLDTSDPKILATYEEIRGESGSADWMILAVAPRLPGATKDIVNVLESGVGGLDEFQQHVGTAAFTGYGYVKHENKFVFAEILPEQLGGADRTLAKKYAKQIMAVLPEHDSTMVVTTGTDKAESPLMHPSIDASGVRKRAPSETSQSSAMFQGKMALSATSLTSELDTSHEDHLKRIRENTISKERYKEEVERKLKVIADQRAKELKWAKDKEAKEQIIKDAFKAEFQAFEDSNRKDHVLGKWLDQMTTDGQFWQNRYMEIQGTTLRLFREGTTPEPAMTIDLRSASVRGSQDTYYLPNTFTIRDSAGREHTLHARDSKDYFQSMAAVERNAGKAKAVRA